MFLLLPRFGIEEHMKFLQGDDLFFQRADFLNEVVYVRVRERHLSAE